MFSLSIALNVFDILIRLEFKHTNASVQIELVMEQGTRLRENISVETV